MSVFFNKTLGRWVIPTRNRSFVYYYRAVVEAHLGRVLRSDEHVHHLNGDSTDDRLENLQVLSNSDHRRLHTLGGRWSRRHERCIGCETTDRRHHAHGLCTRCSRRQRTINERQAA